MVNFHFRRTARANDLTFVSFALQERKLSALTKQLADTKLHVATTEENMTVSTKVIGNTKTAATDQEVAGTEELIAPIKKDSLKTTDLPHLKEHVAALEELASIGAVESPPPSTLLMKKIGYNLRTKRLCTTCLDSEECAEKHTDWCFIEA